MSREPNADKLERIWYILWNIDMSRRDDCGTSAWLSAIRLTSVSDAALGPIHQDVNYQNVTANEPGKRLQNLVNTCWQLGYQGSATAQEPYSNLTALALLSENDGFTFTSGKQGPDYPIASTMATTVTTRQIFVVHWAWLAVNIVVSFILLFCGISGMVFKYKSHAPDIFGFVSSMTRDNPNFENLPGGDKMDGLERARAMRYVHVQIVDAAPWGEGHITLKNVDPLSISYGRTIR